MTIFLLNLNGHWHFICKSFGWLITFHFHDAVQALVCLSNSVLKSGSSILITGQAHGSILEKVALPDWFMQTPPSILIISILINMSMPKSRLSMTRTSAFMGLILSNASMVVPTPSPWRMLGCPMSVGSRDYTLI